MNGKKVYISISVLGILLALTLGAALAQASITGEWAGTQTGLNTTVPGGAT